MPQPNILWICSDQQRRDSLRCYGNGFVNTPHLDELAAQGVLFENAYGQSPVCTPSRTSFLTGRYPRTTRCRQNGQSVPADEVLVTKLLADAGYVCGLAGKLHISSCHPDVHPEGENRRDDGYHEFHWSHAPELSYTTHEYHQWLKERGAQYERVSFRGSQHVGIGMPPDLHQTTWCVEKATGFILSHATSEAPWMFSVNMLDPHHPFDPPREYLERYMDVLDDLPLPSYVPGELATKPIVQSVDHEGAYGGTKGYAASEMNNDDHRLIRAAYWAMCELIDAQVGRLIDALKSTGQWENTLTIFMTDHGEMLGDHGIYLKGPYFYEPAVGVPLIVSWPAAIPPGRRSNALVELVDLAPTLLEMVGVPQHPGMQGKSLWPLLSATTDLHIHRDDVYCEFYNAQARHKNPASYATMVRSERHKLVAMHGSRGVGGELYDLYDDPQETTNLWERPEYLQTKCEMLGRLCDRMAWTIDPLPEREAPS